MPWTAAPYPPRAWQAAALPVVLDSLRAHRVPLVSATMGAGKSMLMGELVATAAPHGQVIVATSTRKLVRQLEATICKWGLDVGTVFTESKQIDAPVVITTYQSLPLLAGRAPVLLLLDEAHRTQAPTVLEAVKGLGARSTCGVTATPYRSDEAESLALFDCVPVSYSMQDAIADGVLVPYSVNPWDGQGDPEDVDGICLRMVQESQGPAVVGALDIADCEAYAKYLREHGVKAASVHSKNKPSVNDVRLKALGDGALDVVVDVAMLTEGVDLPWLTTLVLRRPMGARVAFVQRVGRVLRSHPGKTGAVVYDPHNLFARHNVDSPAQIGEALKPRTKEEAETDEDDWGLPELPGIPSDMPAAQRVDRIASWAERLGRHLIAQGLTAYPRKDNLGKQPATAARLKNLMDLGKHRRHLGGAHKEAAKWAAREGGEHLSANSCEWMAVCMRGLAKWGHQQRTANGLGWKQRLIYPAEAIPAFDLTKERT